LSIPYIVRNCWQTHTMSIIVDNPIQCHILLSIQYNVRNCWQSHTMSEIVDIPIQCQKLLTFPCNVRNCCQSHTMSEIVDNLIQCQELLSFCQRLTLYGFVNNFWHYGIAHKFLTSYGTVNNSRHCMGLRTILTLYWNVNKFWHCMGLTIYAIVWEWQQFLTLYEIVNNFWHCMGLTIRCQKFVCNPIMSEIVDKSIQCQTLTILYNVPESWHSNINSSMYIHIKCILCSYNCLYHVESLV
jgi:hypothetical protein